MIYENYIHFYTQYLTNINVEVVGLFLVPPRLVTVSRLQNITKTKTKILLIHF